jgi:outer membrane immunogenic protein
MKKLCVTGLMLAALTGAAWSADLPMRPYYKAPVAPVSNWTGCYIGGNAGYGWQTNTPTDPSFGSDLGHASSGGFMGGGQIGCDYQFSGNWVIGVQGMFDGSSVNSSYAVPSAYAGDPFETMSFKTDWVGTLTGRIGYVITPQTLLYFKGGGAWSRTSFSDADPSGLSYSPFLGQGNALLSGWTIGGGAEYAIDPHLTAFFEYDYIDVRNNNVPLTYDCGAGCGFANPYPYQETQKTQTVLVGLNYRFNIGPMR